MNLRETCSLQKKFTTVAQAHYLPQSDFEIPSEKKVLEVDIFSEKNVFSLKMIGVA